MLIAGLDNFTDELLGQLLEWSPTVIVLASVAEQVQTYGIKIDWLVAHDPMDITQADIKLIDPGMEPPITAALHYLTQQGYPAVNVVADDWALANYIPFAAKLDLVVFNANKKISVIHSGFKKWKPAGERIEILTPPHNFVYTGLFAETDTVFKTTHDGFIKLNFNDNFLFVAEPL